MPSFDTPRRFHLLRGVRPGLPHPHVRARWPAVDHRCLAPPLRSREPHHRVHRELPGDRHGSAQCWRPVHAPITAQDGWHTYLADHIALLDHLGIDQCHLYGQCIGGPFILSLLKAQPQRIACAVIAQTIGRVGAMPPSRSANFEAWTKTLQDHPEATEQVLDAFNQNLYGPGFVYSVDRAFVASCQTPCLVLAGNDAAHPFAISEEWRSYSPTLSSSRSGRKARPWRRRKPV